MTDFVAQDSGVIIGIPGVGKSHILSRLVISLVEKNIPACLIKLDSLTDGSDDEIANNLGMPDTDWIGNLKAISSPLQGRSTIVFDAFDTLRDEKLKAIVLQKIAQVKKELPEWSVIVSVRTYDAHQSQKLIELFPSGLSQDRLDCRKFTIPELSDEELQLFLEENQRLHALYKVANQRLKEIFKIPFYLKLLDFIITQENADINSLSVIKSEIELLDRYWNKVVGSIKPLLSTEVVLRKLTSEMINIKQLSVNKYDFLEKLLGEEILIVDRLLSENVLKETGATQGQLSYAHNILFDYAVRFYNG
jgi:GTPase SAR1 family protein